MDSLRSRPEIGAHRVEDAVHEPEQEFPLGDRRRPGRMVAHKMIDVGGRSYLLRVFYDPSPGGDLELVSFYRTSQVGRYWRGER
jgi:hypothetical protein